MKTYKQPNPANKLTNKIISASPSELLVLDVLGRKHKQINKQTNKPTNKQTNKQTNKHTNKQTNKQTRGT
jgi:hypothetical protein